MAKRKSIRGYADGGGVFDKLKSSLADREKKIDSIVDMATKGKPPAPARPSTPAPAVTKPITSDEAMAKAARFQWELDHPGVPYVPSKADGGFITEADPEALMGGNARIPMYPREYADGGVTLAPARGHLVRKKYIDGGKIKGVGGPTEDRQPIMVSPGEYVLPADTVKHVGKHKLDKLVDRTHTPVAKQGMRDYANGRIVDDFGNLVDDLGNPVKAAVEEPPGLATRAANTVKSGVSKASDTIKRVGVRLARPFSGTDTGPSPQVAREAPFSYERWTPPGASEPTISINDMAKPSTAPASSAPSSSWTTQVRGETVRGPGWPRVGAPEAYPRGVVQGRGFSVGGLPKDTLSARVGQEALARGMTNEAGKVTARGVASALGRAGMRALPAVGAASMLLEPSALSEPEDTTHQQLQDWWKPPPKPPVELLKMTPEELQAYTATTVNNANAGMYGDQVSRAAQQRGVVTPSSPATFRAPPPEVDALTMKPGEGEGYATGTDAQGVRRVLHAYNGMDTPNVGLVSGNALGAAMGIPMNHRAPTTLDEATARARDALTEAASGKYGPERQAAAQSQLAAMDAKAAQGTANARALYQRDEENKLAADIRQAAYEKERDTGLMSTAPKLAPGRVRQANVNYDQAVQNAVLNRQQQNELERARIGAEAIMRGHELGLRGQLGSAAMQLEGTRYTADMGRRSALAQLLYDASLKDLDRQRTNREDRVATLKDAFTEQVPDPANPGKMIQQVNMDKVNGFNNFVTSYAANNPAWAAAHQGKDIDHMTPTDLAPVLRAYQERMALQEQARSVTDPENAQPTGPVTGARIANSGYFDWVDSPWSNTENSISLRQNIAAKMNLFNSNLVSGKTIELEFNHGGVMKKQKYMLSDVLKNPVLAKAAIEQLPPDQANELRGMIGPEPLPRPGVRR